jgi:cation diffusion facilitator CzcD-associated flavoprotein CzcO
VVQRSVADYTRRSAPSKYHDVLIPDFSLGAKRPVLDRGYLLALHDPRVKLIKSRLISISSPSQVTIAEDGSYPIDVIVLGNGFRSQELLMPMEIVGIGDNELPKLWQSGVNYAAAAHMGSVYTLTNPLLLLYS